MYTTVGFVFTRSKEMSVTVLAHGLRNDESLNRHCCVYVTGDGDVYSLKLTVGEGLHIPTTEYDSKPSSFQIGPRKYFKTVDELRSYLSTLSMLKELPDSFKVDDNPAVVVELVSAAAKHALSRPFFAYLN